MEETMLIIAHRGNHQGQRDIENTVAAIEGADSKGYANEIDLRVYNNDIVLSHDPVHVGRLYDRYRALRRLENPVFLHVKEHGVVNVLQFREIAYDRVFSFYENVPGTTFLFTVKSLDEVDYYGFEDCWVEQPDGEWISSAPEEWTPTKNIFVVSPELHGYELTDDVIASYKSKKWIAGVCTDYPERWL
jgi:hypothetical protein